MASHNEFGKKAELFACEHLITKGYKILERNYYHDRAEIDIIAKKENILAVIEVKARSNVDFGKPEAAVNSKKIKRLIKAANHYVITKDLEVEVRFDIASVTLKNNTYSIELIENAFYHY